MLEFGPARESVLAGEHQLRVGECDWFAGNDAWMMRVKAVCRRSVIAAIRLQQFFGLFAELLQRWTRGQGQRRGRTRHRISFRWRPRPHDGLKEDQAFQLLLRSGGLGPFRGRVRPVTRSGTYPRWS